MSSTVATSTIPSAEDATDYWELSRSPLASLLFVLPILVGYELGAVSLGAEAVRSGAAVWLQTGLAQMGFVGAWLAPALAVSLLLAWHHASGRRWVMPTAVLPFMLVEVVFLTACMVAAAQVQMSLVSLVVASPSSSLPALDVWQELVTTHGRSKLVLYLGAGLYEELLFRLALMPALAWFFASGLAMGRSLSWFLAAIVSSLVFAGAHYLGPHGDVFGWPSFTVRLVAGGFFAALFVLRGFGIAAATHAFYDIWVGCVA